MGKYPLDGIKNDRLGSEEFGKFGEESRILGKQRKR